MVPHLGLPRPSDCSGILVKAQYRFSCCSSLGWFRRLLLPEEDGPILDFALECERR